MKNKPGSCFNLIVLSKYLYLAAGIVWVGVGIMLTNFARIWISETDSGNRWIYIIIGIALGIIKYRFVFKSVVDKNINRICKMGQRINLLLFIPASSYLIILPMMLLGIFLRRSEFPRQYLIMVYLGIGLALFTSSFWYFRAFIKLSQNSQDNN